MEKILNHVEQLEKEYEWLKAVESYELGLNLLHKDDFSGLGRMSERSSYAVYRVAMQAESLNVFKERVREAIASYEKTMEFYEKSIDAEAKGRTIRCRAMLAFLGYWLAPVASEKKKLLSECWKLAKEALEAFEDAKASLEYGKIFNQLSMSSIFGFTLESDFQSRVRLMKETVDCGEKAVNFLSTSNSKLELARAYARTVVCLGLYGYYCQNGPERDQIYQKAAKYWQKANELSEEIATLESLYPVFGGQPLFGLEGSDQAISNYNKGLEFAKKTRDRFFTGCAFDWLVYHTVWKTTSMEDKDQIAQLAKTVLQYIAEAREQFSEISFTSPRADLAWIEASPADTDMWLAGYEEDVKKKRELLEKAVKAAPEMLKRAEDSGYPEAIGYAHAIFGAILQALAQIETNRDEKKRLLEQALEQRIIVEAGTERLAPLLYWNRGVNKSSLAMAKTLLADVTDDDGTKRKLLEEVAVAREEALKLLSEELSFFQSKRSTPTSLFASYAGSQSAYGDVLNRLFGLTGNRDCLKKAIGAFKEATEWLQKLKLRSRIAECFWKISKAYDMLGEYSDAAQYFGSASDSYEGAAESIPQLKDFYQDHACYMQAWSEIEKARYHHQRQEYGLAEEHFEKAANMHKSLKKWSYLTPNYAAWAQVEHAEELSRKERGEEALQAFQQAIRLFEETRESIIDGLAKIEDPDEKQMATQMIQATNPRREYCSARIAIEEARILDKKGDHFDSSEKYRLAAETIQKVSQTVQSEQDKKEFNLIAALSQAWAKMTQAEAEGSPELYIEASELFEKAKELSPNEKAKMLALGHSRFCRALEAGTKFADTGDPEMYKIALQHLESAAKHYVRAGLQNASEYAKATGLLLDAYLHMNTAKVESDPEKKARLYMMAEKVLQTSAGSFMKAEHPEKREQVLRLLERVKEERELALSLNEVLHAPTMISATSAFVMPMPNQENAVGLEKFERANIQANLVMRQKELKVGEDLKLEIELVNAGKSPAQLIKISEVIPKGFEITQSPEIYRVEDSYINMKGKRLDPLKTEEIKVSLRPKNQGEFEIKPRVLYLDETGKYKIHELEPASIVVKELGIKGWLKGER